VGSPRSLPCDTRSQFLVALLVGSRGVAEIDPDVLEG
jgi:hypothetical protein